MEVTFIDTVGNTPDDLKPVPARTVTPAWYRNTPAWRDDTDGLPEHEKRELMTVKKCMPLLDSLTLGYIIPTPSDLEVERTPDGVRLYWPSRQTVDIHIVGQTVEYPSHKQSDPMPKWISNWGVRTPSGYSCLFVSPFHHDLPFRTLAGVVDTDTYFDAVNFPFLIDPNFSGLIPAGTPMAQVIPFRRDEFTHTVVDEADMVPNVVAKVRNQIKMTFRRGYQDRFWHRKEYR